MIDKNKKPIKIAVGLFNISKPWALQKHLFTKENKSQIIYDVVDKINNKYGIFSIYPANILRAQDSAPNRIAFGKPIHE